MTTSQSSLLRERRRATLSAALRGVRQRLGLRTQAVADRMGMELRSYERFEAAEGRIDLDRLFLFSEATNSDPLALVCSLYLDAPELAVRCADNKLMLIQAIALEQFDKRLGDDIRRIDAATLISAFEAMFEDLIQAERRRSETAKLWLERHKPTEP